MKDEDFMTTEQPIRWGIIGPVPPPAMVRSAISRRRPRWRVSRWDRTSRSMGRSGSSARTATSTPRAGSAPSNILDMLGHRTDKHATISYARIRL